MKIRARNTKTEKSILSVKEVKKFDEFLAMNDEEQFGLFDRDELHNGGFDAYDGSIIFEEE
jgi:hypothetical protein